MKHLLKIMLVVALVFASTFVIARLTGLLTVEKVEAMLTAASKVSPWYIAAITTMLLFADLFIAVPTLSIILITGFFLGPVAASSASFLGLLMAGVGGYILSDRYGDKLLTRIMKDPEQRKEAKEAFQAHGFVTILLSRALPMLPEVSACMAGLTGMKFWKFIIAWVISTAPYVMIAAYAGSISSIDNPKPAIFTAIGLMAFLWTGWFIFNRRHKKAK